MSGPSDTYMHMESTGRLDQLVDRLGAAIGVAQSQSLGLSRRDEIAARMMASLKWGEYGDLSLVAYDAVRMADALIDELDTISASRATEQPK